MTIRSKMMRFLPPAAVLAVLLQAQCLLVPEDVDVTDRVANKRPTVRITAGAARPDSAGVDYKVQFHWHGYDSDGVVTHFQWAVNDTVSEGAWRDTTAFSARFHFTATTPSIDSPNEATDWHTFYVRAIDNDLAVSVPDQRFFNALTIAPTSRITFPRGLDQTTTPQLQQTIAIEWDGEDLDSSRPDRKPVAYEFKLVRVLNSFDPERVIRDSLLNANNILLDTLRVGSKKRWIRVSEADRRFLLRELPPSPPAYAFAVRAIDEAGAVEPSLQKGRNFISFDVTQQKSAPHVLVREPSVGTHLFPVQGDVWEIDVPANRPLYFRWTGDASDYGSLPGNSNYGLDIPDPEDESFRDPSGIGGWVGWGNWGGNREPIIFGNEDGGTIHTFYLYMRDISDAAASTQRCTVRMRVVSFTFERFALVVDDARFSTGITDQMHDAFLEATTYKRLRDFGDVDERRVFTGANESGRAEGIPLHVVAQYRHILWNHHFREGSAHFGTGLIITEGDKVLSSYLGAGGRLFLFGGQQASAFISNWFYPKRQPSADDVQGWDEFFRKFLYFRNIIVSERMADADGSNNACVTEAGALYVARSRHPAYPDLYLDLSKRDPWEVTVDGKYRGGIRVWEGNTSRAQHHRTEDLRLEGLDTLYVAQTWDRAYNPLCGALRSPAGGSICAQRYESTPADSLAGQQHGRVVTFNFMTWFLQPDRLLDANTAAINWLVTGRDQ